MALINLDFMQRYQTKLDTAIKNFVADKLESLKEEIDTQQITLEGTAIAVGVDLDDIQTTGNYRIPDDTTAGSIVNLPLDLCGKVIVADTGNGGLLQIYIPNHEPHVFQRLYWSNAWTSWMEVASKSYVDEIMCAESVAGTYTLKATVSSGGTVTYTWEAEE